PDELVHDLFFRSVFPNHPLGRPVLGYNETIGRVDRDRVEGYWRERYSPKNLVVASAGHVDHSDLVGRIQALFDDTQGVKTGRDAGSVPLETGVNVFHRPTEQAHIVVGTEGLRRGHEDLHALTLLDTILGGGMSSRLFQEIREKRGLAYSVYSYRSMFADTGTFGVYAGTTPQNADNVIDIIQSEIATIVDSGLTDSEFARAKGHVKGSLVLSAEDPGSRMNRLGRQQLTTGEILSLDEMIARYDALEKQDVERVARDLLQNGKFRITVVGPFEDDAFNRYAA
ncbi:MAG: M16 family metallopeptidase, partial [Actinomycetota bacterium]